MAEPLIIARQVAKYFGDFPALRSIDLEVQAGEALALLGRNGAGKSTLLQLFAGLSQPTSGAIELRVGGSDFRQSVGVLGHGQWLYDDLTAAENLNFFAQLYAVQDAPGKIDSWLELTGLSRFRDSRVNEFSRGMRQRLAIARAFLHEPRVLLLDEPWTALDDRAIRFLSDRMTEARQRGATLVVCSHQLREALEVADRVAVLDRGRLAYVEEVSEALRANPDSLYERLS
ncbi:MAG: heme ABC exporter ATP-binding protein CcmA [Acidobacteria bacterium]|nr:heme ABC exporter ATP-binding protein CcmA [Acidobacteriota bacterium]